jgi:DNA repair exonuclease SbcCD nuclease subunit
MKLILFSDLHLDTPFRWAPAEVARRRRQSIRNTLQKIAELAQAERVDAVLCGGDLYEQDYFSPDTAAFVRSVFERLDPIRVFVSPGNHDWFGPQSLYNRSDWSPNVHIFREDRLQPVVLEDGLNLWGAAHRAPANTDGFLDGFHVDRGGTNFALFHGSERGWLTHQESGKEPHAPFDAEQIESSGLQHAFLGHYHRCRDAERHTYPGNPDPLTFGEDGERGAVVIDVAADGSVRRERRRVNSSVLYDECLDITGCSSQQDVRGRITEILRGREGVARVTLHGELDPSIDLRLSDLLDAAPWMECIVPRPGKFNVAYDLDALAREQTVRGEFVRDVMAAELDEDVRRRVLTTGLRALDGREDLEAP